MNRRKFMENCFGLGAGLALLKASSASANLNSNKSPSPLSQKIAKYLVQNGTPTHTKAGFPGYEIRKVLPDGRKLMASIAYFSDISEKGPENVHKNTVLRLSIIPVKDDQFGEFSMECGLEGKFETYRILTGTSDKMVDGWFHFARDNLSVYTKEHLQKKYGGFRERFYNLLKDNSKSAP